VGYRRDFHPRKPLPSKTAGNVALDPIDSEILRLLREDGRMSWRDLGAAVGLSANAVALAPRVPANRLTETLNGRRAITAETAMRLGRYFGTSAQMWVNLQAKYDLGEAEEKLAEHIDLEVVRGCS